MHSSFGIERIVGKRHFAGRDVINILERDFNADVINRLIAVEYIFVNRFLDFVVESDERNQSTFKVESRGRNFKTEFSDVENALIVNFFFAFARIQNTDAKTADQVRLLPKMRDDLSQIEFDFAENFRIGFKSNDGSMQVCFANLLHRRFRFSLRILLKMDSTFLVNDNIHESGKRVHDRRTDAVQASGNLISSIAEFTAGMKRGNDGFQSGNFCLGVNVNRNAAAVVGNANAVIRQKYDFNIVRKIPHRFIARVIKDFPNEMVKSFHTS